MMQPCGEFVVLEFGFCNGEPWPIALLLLDAQDRLHVRARPAAHVVTGIPPENVEVIALW